MVLYLFEISPNMELNSNLILISNNFICRNKKFFTINSLIGKILTIFINNFGTITSVLTSLGLFNLLPLNFKSKKSRRHNHSKKKKKKNPAPNLAKSPMGIES